VVANTPAAGIELGIGVMLIRDRGTAFIARAEPIGRVSPVVDSVQFSVEAPGPTPKVAVDDALGDDIVEAVLAVA